MWMQYKAKASRTAACVRWRMVEKDACYPTQSNTQNIGSQNSQFVYIEATHDSVNEWGNRIFCIFESYIFYHRITACHE